MNKLETLDQSEAYVGRWSGMLESSKDDTLLILSLWGADQYAVVTPNRLQSPVAFEAIP